LINLLPFLENRLITLLKMIVFWDIAPCRLTEVDQRFRRAYFLHQGGGGDDDDGGTTHPRNAGLLQRDYMALYPTKLSSSCHEN
jgi:hypothetical protein